MVTTGTRLGTAATELDVPIQVVGRTEIDRTPYVEVADYLKSFPAFTGAGNINDTSTNGGAGDRNIDLRGLGSQYTLVLLNGRRLAQTGIEGTVDINQIPMNAVDHIEVVTSGASAIYGTDAIAGVVNVITKKGMSGGQIDAYYGDTLTTTDFSRRQFGFSLNGSEGRIDFLVGGQYFKQNGVYSPDFDWSSRPGPTSNTFPYRFSLPNSLFTAGATGNGFYVVKWRPGEGGARDATVRTDLRSYDGRQMNLTNLDAGGDQFPFFLYTPLIRPEERWSIFAFNNLNLTPNLRVFVDLTYRWAYSYNQLAPAAVPVPSGGAIVIPSTNFWNQQIFGASAPTIVSGNWRMLGLGPRVDSNTAQTFWVNGGLAGKVNAYNWQLAATLSQDNWENENGGSGRIDVLNQLLARTDNTAFNPFTSKPTTNAALWNDIKATAWNRQFSRNAKVDFTLDGRLGTLPAGDMTGALTVEWQKQKFYEHPDALQKAVPLGFNGILQDTDGHRTVYGAAVELKAPIAPKLDVRGALRRDHYSDFGTVNVWQGSAAFRPTNEMLLRGSFSQGFIVPTIRQLYEGDQLNNPTFNDPSAKTASGWGENTQVSIVRVGNPNLKPERSRNWGAGIVFTPANMQNYTISADYWDIKQKSVVSLAEEAARFAAFRFWQVLGSSDAARDAAARNPVTRTAAQTQVRNETGITVNYTTDGGPSGLGGLDTSGFAEENVSRQNIAGQNSKGVDIGLKYSREMTRGGRIGLDLNASYQWLFERQPTPTDPFTNLTGMYSSTFEGSWPRWRFVASLPWSSGAWSFVPTYNYTGPVVLQDGMDPTFGYDRLGSFGTWDFQLNYEARSNDSWLRNMRFTVGLENAFDYDVPLTSFSTNNNVPAGSYDVKGQFAYARVSRKF